MREVKQVREWIRQAGRPWADEHPLATSQLQAWRERKGSEERRTVFHYKALEGCRSHCLCTGALLYCSELDRLVHPKELLSCFGWPDDVKRAGLNWTHIADMVGESQALQVIGVASLSLLASCGQPCGWC